VDADANAADMMFTPGMNAPIENPIFVINNYSGAEPQVMIDDKNAQADVDYFATIDEANTRVWITLNKTVADPIRLRVNGGSSGVMDNESEGISVFPNPTTGMIQIQNSFPEGSTVQITDNQGNIIETQNLPANQQIDIRNQPNGLYFIKIVTGSQRITKRIIKRSN